MKSIVFVLLLALCATGCVVNPPPPEGQVASAYAVGDRARVGYDEVVVSLPYAGATNAPYQNLHVALTAFINARQKTSVSEWDADGIVRRCQGRIMARVSEVLYGYARDSGNVAGMRQTAVKEAQAIVDAAMRKWEHGDDYAVEIAVSSLYWTDASVGPAQVQRGWW